MYFWRTKQQQEIDLVEERDGKIECFEFKWSDKKVKFPENFRKTYQTEGQLIHRKNFREFISITN